jgi:hypothetical protein
VIVSKRSPAAFWQRNAVFFMVRGQTQVIRMTFRQTHSTTWHVEVGRNMAEINPAVFERSPSAQPFNRVRDTAQLLQ